MTDARMVAARWTPRRLPALMSVSMAAHGVAALLVGALVAAHPPPSHAPLESLLLTVSAMPPPAPPPVPVDIETPPPPAAAPARSERPSPRPTIARAPAPVAPAPRPSPPRVIEPARGYRGSREAPRRDYSRDNGRGDENDGVIGFGAEGIPDFLSRKATLR